MANGQVQIVGSETVSPGSLTNQFQGRKRWRRKLGSKRGSRDLSWIHTSAKRYKNYGTRDTWQLEPRLLFDMEELLWLSVVTIFQLCLKCLSFTNDTDMPMVEMIWAQISFSSTKRRSEVGAQMKELPQVRVSKKERWPRGFQETVCLEVI